MAINDKDAQEILSSLELLGDVDEESAGYKILINRNVDENVIDKSNGRGRIKNSLLKQFELIREIPLELEGLSRLEIRCFNCGKVLTLPAFLLKKEMIKNKFYYFLCFGSKVNLDNCHR